jgi:hypothetical protein
MKGETLDGVPAAGQPGSAARMEAVRTEGIRRHLDANRSNGCVGSVPVFETERVRERHLHLPAGERRPFRQRYREHAATNKHASKQQAWVADRRE